MDKFRISKSSAPDRRMPGDITDSRVVRLTIDLCPGEQVPRITAGPDGSLIVDLTKVQEGTRDKVLAALRRKIWSDVSITEIG